ncbi:MAG: hypothetical protein H7301_03960 [Cryobacterium sp.]|nr:hypothetical protein [Oligoflexia bacterium]
MSVRSPSCSPFITAFTLASAIALAASGNARAGSMTKTEPAKIARDAIALLDRIPSGKKVLTRAENFWNEHSREGLLKHFAYGPVSRTDAVLTRHYDPETGLEVRERFVTVVLKRDQPIMEVAMDLGHELVHATTPPAWDPYDPKLTAGLYMHAALEANGGEVDAVFAECEIAVDLKRELDLRSNRCDRYLVLSGDDNRLSVDRGKIQADFYRVGKWDRFVREKLGKEASDFILLSKKEPELYSATGGAPYPVALMREYEELNRVACENVRKRAGGRAPASVWPAGENRDVALGNRCQGMSFSSRASD